ncbi:MAG: PEP/pyruvate-binding domain-containing protein, partial [Chloroflexota bacterium]
RAGFAVPSGFVVTTAAYDSFVADNGLGPRIRAALYREEPAGAAIRDAFAGAAVPPAVAEEILAAYAQLGRGAVAVRSSATAEDLPQAAFAGQQDTYLNVVSNEALLDGVRSCWASLWSDRAIAYRERLELSQETVKMAVVVQRMVAADAAGVLFTANTVSGARDEVLIDASPGLGEAVVSGLVTPDHYVLKKRWRRWRIVQRQEGRREVVIRARPGGGTEHVEQEAAEGPALADGALRQLARTAVAIQEHFGAPQDIEWARARGQLFILQARPITALPEPAPEGASSGVRNRARQFIAGNFAEIFALRPYPLDVDVLIPALAGALEPMFEVMGLDWRLHRQFVAEDGVVVRFEGRLPRPTWRVLLAPARFLWRVLRYDPLQWRSDPVLEQMRARTRALESRESETLSWAQLLEVVRAATEVPCLAGQIRQRYFPRAAFAAARLRLLLTLLGRADRLGALLSGAHNKTLEANRALEDLSNRVRSDAQLARAFSGHEPQQLASVLQELPSGRAFLDDFRAFLDRYGHREMVISTLSQPAWADAPEVVLGIVKSLAAGEPQPQSGAPAWQAARDSVLQHRLLRIGPLRAAFLKTLAEARTLLPIREDTHFYATLPLPVMRRTLLECGRRLTNAGVLQTEEEVFHLRLEELQRVADEPILPADFATKLRDAVARRREARERLKDTPLVDPRLMPRSAAAGDALLRGISGSPGVAQGPACIVRDSSEFAKVVAGDVLVAPYTNPSWTPLFQRAVAVVVDSGSPASHAAIVAREYGIPAVMGTVTGTKTVRDGQRLRVDGSQGAVFGMAEQEER